MATQTYSLNCTGMALVDSTYPSRNVSGQSSYVLTETTDSESYRLYVKYDDIPDNIKSYKVNSVSLTLYTTAGYGRFVYMYAPTRDFDVGTITYNTRTGGKKIGTYQYMIYDDESTWPKYYSETAVEKSQDAALVLKYTGVYFTLREAGVDGSATISSTLQNGTTPTLTISYDDSVVISPSINITNAVTSGYVNPRTANTFEWELVSSSSYARVAPFEQQSATLNWRIGNSGAWNTISPSSATDTTITIPANTFPAASTIQWLITAMVDGNMISSSTYTVNTTAAAMVSTPVSPIDTIEDNSASITFSWTSTASDGQAQSGAQLQYSSDGGSTWSTLASVGDSSTSIPVAGGTLPSGAILWRVRGRNVDNTYGSWSSPVSFVSYGAPAAPVVTATAESFTTITWQATSQEAYRIYIDGNLLGPFFGSEKTYSPEEYLEQGTHLVGVAVQNSFGLWSAVGTASITITVPSSYLILRPTITSSKFRTDAVINWYIYFADSTTALYIYRDEKRIAEITPTSTGSYTDRFVLGTHTYTVVQRRSNYAVVSDGVSGTMKSCTTRIAPLSGGEWIELELSENSNRTEDFAFSKYVSMRHFSGSEWPVAEIGFASDESCSYTVSFSDLNAAKTFEQLRGQAVIIKSRGGQVMVGVLSDLQKSMQEFYITYQFVIQRMHWRDYVNETN